MKVDIVTLFPEMLSGPLDESILKRAREKGLVKIRLHGLRDFTRDKHKMVDDRPFGGGPGMVIKPEPVFEGSVQKVPYFACRRYLGVPLCDFGKKLGGVSYHTTQKVLSPRISWNLIFWF